MKSQDASIRWFAYRVVPQSEFRTLAEIIAEGFMAFISVGQKPTRVGRHGTRLSTFPLVPGYMFVAFRRATMWRDMERLADAGIDTLRQPLGLVGSPSPIREYEIAAISDASGHTTEPPPARSIEKGCRAKITSGIYAGRIVTVEEVAKKRARAPISVLGYAAPTWIPLSILQAV